MSTNDTNTKKRILIFSTAYLPFIGGAEMAIKEITDRISDIQFDLITAKMRKGLPFREIIGNITVYRLGIGKPFIDKLILLLEGALFVRHLKKRNDYTAYWCVMISFSGWAAIINNWFSRKKIPIFLTIQEGDSEKHLKFRWFGLINWSWKVFLSNASKVTAISNYLIERARKHGFKGEGYLIPNGVSIEKFSISNSQFSKKDFGFDSFDTVLVTTSRLVEKNAVGDVIDALKLLPEDVKFLIIGSGPLERELKLKAKNLKLEARIRFLGEINHGEIPKYLHVSDIFIRPSLSEGMGSSFIEAMAVGLPVIATPIGGIVDFLFDPVTNPEQPPTGLFCKINDPESIVRQVQKYLKDENLRKQIILNARRLVSQKYDWDLVAKQMNNQVFSALETIRNY